MTSTQQKLVWLVIVLVSGIYNCFGQQEPERVKEIAGSGGFEIGYTNINTSPLNVFLPTGHDLLTNNYFTIGGSGYWKFSRLLIGISGQGLFSNSAENDSLRTKATGGVGFFNLGYAIISKDNFKLFPMIGVGPGSFKLNIAETQDISANQIATDPRREITASFGGFMFDFALGLDFIPFMRYEKNGQEGGGLKIGLRVGYLVGLKNDSWSYSGGNITDGPDFSIRGFYIKAIFGVHGMSKTNVK